VSEIAKPKKRKRARQRGSGGIFRPNGGRIYWIKYVSGGKVRYESSKSDRLEDAQALLTDRLDKIQKGVLVTPKLGKLKLRDGLTAVVNDLKLNGKKSDDHTQRRIDKHILKHFDGDRWMSTITTSDLTAYVVSRREEKAASASCNHELAIIRRAFRLAVRGGQLLAMPHIPMLQLDNARQGFLEPEEFEAILKHMPDLHLHAPLRFAFETGWRLNSEVLPMRVGQVDLKVGIARLEPGTTKNKEGRTFYLTAALQKILKAQLIEIEELQAKGVICPYVFHLPSGAQIRGGYIRQRWNDAREKAGYPAKIFHDFRRSAVRTLERAAVPRTVAMQMVGHKTESMYRRYAIVDDAMLKEATAKLEQWNLEQRAKAKAERRGQLRRFAKRASA
jgi:integrase